MFKALLCADKVNVKDEASVGRDDASSTTCTIAKLGRDKEPPGASHRHGCDAHVHAPDDLAYTQAKGHGATIKLLAVLCQTTRVADGRVE